MCLLPLVELIWEGEEEGGKERLDEPAKVESEVRRSSSEGVSGVSSSRGEIRSSGLAAEGSASGAAGSAARASSSPLPEGAKVVEKISLRFCLSSGICCFSLDRTVACFCRVRIRSRKTLRGAAPSGMGVSDRGGV